MNELGRKSKYLLASWYRLHSNRFREAEVIFMPEFGWPRSRRRYRAVGLPYSKSNIQLKRDREGVCKYFW